jgi:hypothetical protein
MMANLPVESDFSGDPQAWYAIAVNEVNAANQYLVKLATATAGINPPTIDAVFPNTPDAPALLVANPPQMEQIIWELPGLPAAFSGTLSIDNYMPDPFDAQPPTLSFGAAPAPFSEPLPDAPGVNLVYEAPTLSVELPAPPSLLSIQTSRFDGINMPTIDSNVPQLSVVAPSVVQYVPGQLYTSSLLSASQATLERFIVDGGTGLPPAVEEALWNRAREREYRQAADSVADLDRMEVLGYAFPPGMYLNARIKINTELAYNVQTLNREIAIEQAKLEQENLRWAMQNAVQLEGQMISYRNSTEQRAFDSTKYATEAGIAIYNAQVQAYGAFLDAYKTKVAIYDSQVRAELARVEAYKAEIAAEQAKAEINNALVQQYKVAADVALANVDIYKAEIAGIQAKAEIEKLKIEIFGEQVRGYAAKVNAYTAGVEGFRATIAAETSKQEAFKSQVEVYSAQVDAAVKTASARIEEFKGQIMAKTAEWDGYKAAVAAASARAQAIAQINSATADTYRAEASAVASYNDVLTKQWQAAVEQAQRVAEIGVAAAKANAELFVSTRSLALESAKVGAQVSAQIGSAALNSSNWSWSRSYARSVADSYSNNYSKSDSYSESVSTSYNYSASV